MRPTTLLPRAIPSALLLLLCLGCHKPTLRETLQTVSADEAVTVTDVHVPSASIDGMLWYRAIVPRTGVGEQLPVLYLLHGANSGPIEIMEHSAVRELASAARLIVIMPEADLSYYTNAKHKSHSRWEEAITQELPRDVEARFPVLRGRTHTGVAGISMGGYGSAKLALKHPELYGFAGNMSGALDITRRPLSLRRWQQTWRIAMIFGVRPREKQDEDVFALLGASGKSQKVHWFDSCGKEDPLRGINERFVSQLRQRGADLDTMVTPGGHDWQSWNAAIPELLKIASKTLR